MHLHIKGHEVVKMLPLATKLKHNLQDLNDDEEDGKCNTEPLHCVAAVDCFDNRLDEATCVGCVRLVHDCGGMKEVQLGLDLMHLSGQLL